MVRFFAGLLVVAAAAATPRLRLFGVGFKKTGTTSFSNACTMLGLDEMGLGAKAALLRLEAGALRRRRGALAAFLAAVAPYECFQDSPFTSSGLVPVLAAAFPEAKFVLTTRNSSAAWADSAFAWVARKTRENPRYGATFWAKLGWTEAAAPDRAAAAGLVEAHDAAVVAHFAGPNASRLLVLDFGAEADPEAFWDKLCAFVALPTRCPRPPVPRANARAAAVDADGQPLRRALRWGADNQGYRREWPDRAPPGARGAVYAAMGPESRAPASRVDGPVPRVSSHLGTST